MRILKSIGLVVAGGLYALLVANLPLLTAILFVGLILAVGVFCWGYFILFEPKR